MQSWSALTNLDKLTLHGNSLDYCKESEIEQIPDNIKQVMSYDMELGDIGKVCSDPRMRAGSKLLKSRCGCVMHWLPIL